MSSDFFEKLPGFTGFNNLGNDRHFERAPSDWWVVITDVIGSTRAIEQGRYKDVNMIGAATLAALQNAMPEIVFPFAFGGDGASALIPPEYKEAAERELSGLRHIARERCDLGLRAGMISVGELENESSPVWVGKHLLDENYPLAIFRGGALAIAEERIKGDIEQYSVPECDHAETDLRHLSCRWQPLVSTAGQILSVLFLDPKGRLEVYGEFLRELDALTENGTKAANPVQASAMNFRGLFEMLKADCQHQRSILSLLPRLIDTFVAYVLFNWGLFRLFPGLRRYVTKTPSHSDFRKFDDMLRMVLDISPEQADAIESLCLRYRRDWGTQYGLHRSETALMTCYAPSLSAGNDIHFIDGGDGGYAIAAKQLKQQMKGEGATTPGSDQERPPQGGDEA